MDYEKAYKEALERAKSLIDKEGLTEGSYPNRNACEAIFPELAGSEDERIRAEIVEFLLNGIWAPTEISRVKESQRYAKWIAYLEKQKEQKQVVQWPNLSNCKHDCKTCFTKCIYRKEQNEEQKPAEQIEESKEKSIGITLIDALKGNAQLEWEIKRAGVNVKKLITYLEQKEQKPVEWSEKDKFNLKSCIGKIEIDIQHWGNHGKTMVDGDIKLIEWLKSLPERFNLQSKQEWSEEDKKMLNTTLSFFPILKGLAEGNMILGREGDQVKVIEECWAWLKSLRPQSHWKPSEEQIWALQAIINDPNNAGAESCQLAIKSLYDDLKKL